MNLKLKLTSQESGISSLNIPDIDLQGINKALPEVQIGCNHAMVYWSLCTKAVNHCFEILGGMLAINLKV
jgi:hypothetical protein